MDNAACCVQRECVLCAEGVCVVCRGSVRCGDAALGAETQRRRLIDRQDRDGCESNMKMYDLLKESYHK